MITTFDSVLCFDGDCNLCNGFVQWVIRNDQKQRIKFANLQSGFAKRIAIDHQLDPDSYDSIFYWREGKLYLRSEAILKLAKDLGGIYRLAAIGYVIPRRIRDQVYNLIASQRYRILGRPSQCLLPTPELKKRFIV
jgi:predicted DCC family thiol-disulfide oxidoreductase YuxK